MIQHHLLDKPVRLKGRETRGYVTVVLPPPAHGPICLVRWEDGAASWCSPAYLELAPAERPKTRARRGRR